jgi:uncharacterized membrane protein
LLVRGTSSVLIAGTAVWCAAILAAPLTGIPAFYEFFTIICHQQAGRSWHIFGEPLAVCIRCASIYFGFFAGLLLLQAPNPRWLKIALMITAAEWLSARLFIDIELLRAMSGVLLGAVAAPIIRTGVEEMFARFAHEPM